MTSTLARGLHVLEFLAQHAEVYGQGLAEISRALHYDKSTTYRYLNTLQRLGYVGQDEDTGQYSLGPRLLALSGAYLDSQRVRSEASPFLLDLMRETNESVHLAVLDGVEAVYIDRVDSPQPVRMWTHIGSRVPLHCTAVGKAILAYSPKGTFDRVVAAGLKRMTANTITDPQMLQKELATIRRRGFAIDRRENRDDIACAAAPIFDYSGKVVAALSVSAPAARMSDDEACKSGSLVKAAAEQVSRRLGNRS